jgi:aryl-alcohol dehydrogenase-like predicted oxidoreductase
MRYRKLGHTGLSISEMGLGTYTLSGAMFTKGDYWEGPCAYGHVSTSEARDTILHGLSLGMNFIDTAPVYGSAEAIIGEVLSGQLAGVVVETKTGECLLPGDILARDFSEAQIRRSVAESKRRLRRDVLDILLLHTPTADEFDAGEPLEILCRLRDEGETNFIGVSVGDAREAIPLIKSGKVDVLQLDFNLLQPQAADDVFPLAQEAGVGIVARSPLASGFLTGRIKEEHVFAPDDFRSAMSREDIARIARRAEAFEFLVRDGANTIAEAALRYALSFDAVSTVIAGAMNRTEIEQNLAVSDKGPLSAAVLGEIRAVQQQMD